MGGEKKDSVNNMKAGTAVTTVHFYCRPAGQALGRDHSSAIRQDSKCKKYFTCLKRRSAWHAGLVWREENDHEYLARQLVPS